MNGLQRALRRPALLLAWLVIALVVSVALFPSAFTHYSAIASTPGDQLLAPGGAHLMGTDQLGRDIYARVVYGASRSLAAAAIAVAMGLVAGTLLGLLSGGVGGKLDQLLMRCVDVLLAVPALLLSLTVLILIGFGTLNAAIAVGIASIANFARLTRGEVLRVRREEYVEAAYGAGGSFAMIVWRHILPNVISPVLAFAALQFGHAILMLATLSFLGFGTPPPQPEWGLMVADGRNYMSIAWWLTACPGAMIVAVVLATNRISRQLAGERQ